MTKTELRGGTGFKHEGIHCINLLGDRINKLKKVECTPKDVIGERTEKGFKMISWIAVGDLADAGIKSLARQIYLRMGSGVT
ncbi:hypothetical protein Leryth_021357 [Lithospermum erythrorhizon]|nr:hypothetical protein Leryth_021357 [Lithospermum erythrorhizon]